MTYAITMVQEKWQRKGLDTSYLAELAKLALIAEAELTPKPGLVDRRSSGSHKDLSLQLMKCSAERLEPFFKSMADISRQLPLGQSLREQLGIIGRNAESGMYLATRE